MVRWCIRYRRTLISTSIFLGMMWLGFFLETCLPMEAWYKEPLYITFIIPMIVAGTASIAYCIEPGK